MEISDVRVQIENALRSSNGKETQIKIDFSLIQKFLQIQYSLANDILAALEDENVNLAYHSYDSETSTLTLQSYELVDNTSGDSGNVDSGNPINDNVTVDAYVFLVASKGKTYQCYSTPSSADLVVQVAESSYYCKLQE